MAQRKIGRKRGTPKNSATGRLATDKRIGGNGGHSRECDANEVFRAIPTSSVGAVHPHLSTSPASESELINGKTKHESNSDEDIASFPTLLEGNPDPYWVKEWAAMDLRSAVASQVEFFNTRPKFNNSNAIYVLFFVALRSTIREAAVAKTAITRDVTARANLKSLQICCQDFMDRSKCLLREDLERIKAETYSRYSTSNDFRNLLSQYNDFLNLTREMAFFLGLGEEWKITSTFLRATTKRFTLAQQQGVSVSAHLSVQDIQPAKSPVHTRGPLSSEILKMDYEFTNAMWSQWIESFISYFEYWTAEPTWDIPAHDFIRHLSHYRLAMELFLKHKSVSEEKLSALVELAKKYAWQYNDYAATQLETKYAELKEDVKKTDIYNTEARFWRIADDIEVLMNESPEGVTIVDWNDAAPSILPQDKVLAAKDAVSVLYNEFQTKRYPEDEVAYLWLLTWRNIKHGLPHLISSPGLDASRPEAERLTDTIEPRDLALPFVEKNLSQLLNIVRKDNDALYQREIESLVGDYCAHIHRYAKGEGKGQDRVYEQFARLSHIKRVPFTYLVNLEESLLKNGAKPSNSSQMIAHRVVKRLNHIMEGPMEFNRWEHTDTGTIKTYSPTSTWVAEQEALRQAAGFNLDYAKKPPSSPQSYFPSQSLAAGAGAGGDDDSDGDEQRKRLFGDNGESSDSSERVEEISPGGTKRIKKQKKGRRASPSIAAETLTKAKLEQLMKLAKRPDSDSMGVGLGSKEHGEAEEERHDDIMSGLHFLPHNILDYHRRRLNLLRVEELSALPNAQYPLPETAAPQRAAALQIARDLADPGIFTDGPRPEDVQNYISPALRLPLAEEDNDTGQQVRRTAPNLIRRSLVKLRTTLGSPFFGASPRHSPPRATPRIPESNSQRARRELEARETTPPVLKRQADKFSVTKSPPRNGSPRRSTYKFTSVSDSREDSSRTDADLPWSSKGQGNHSASSSESSYRAGHTTQENQTPSPSSPRNNSNQENQASSGSSATQNSNQENESPRRDLSQENQESTNFTQQAQHHADDWNSSSPPQQYDNNIYQGSPLRSHSSPTPVKGDNSGTSSGPRLPAFPPAGAQARPGGRHENNVDASPLVPQPEDGPSSQLRRLNRWVRMEIACNNQDMRAAYLLHRQLVGDQTPNALIYLFELLRGHVEMATFNNYVFERTISFGTEVRAQAPEGVPTTVHAPGTPRAQIDRRSQRWWNDPLEGTSQGFRRTGVAWAEPPNEEREFTHDSQSGLGLILEGSGSTSTILTPVTPSPIRDENGNPIPWEVIRATDPLYGRRHIPTSPFFSDSDPDRTWSWHSHPSTGLPQREFNIYIDPDTRPSTHPSGLGEPLLVDDPLDPGQLTTNPRFSPEILRLISAAGRDDRGQINVRVPPGWTINVEPRTGSVRSRTPTSAERSTPDSSFEYGPAGEQQVSFTSPGFVIHEDASSGAGSGDGGRGSVWQRTNAPPTLGLIDPPSQEEQRDDDNAAETLAEKANQKSQATTSSFNREGGSRSARGNRSESASNPSNSNPDPPSQPSPPPRPPPRATKSAPPPTWYLAWPTSTVIALREEIRRRGIPLSGLRLKQQMIDRLRRDDAENGVGGVYHPTEEEEDAAEREEVEGDEGNGSKNGVHQQQQDGNDDEHDDAENRGQGMTATATAAAAACRPVLKRRHDPFLLDWKTLGQAVGRDGVGAGSVAVDVDGQGKRKRFKTQVPG